MNMTAYKRLASRSRFWSAAFALGMTSLPLLAQGPADLDALASRGALISRHPETGLVRFVGKVPSTEVLAQGDALLPNSDAAFDDYLRRFGPPFGITDSQSQTRLHRRHVNERGRTMTRYQQIHQNVPVFAGELILNTDSKGNLLALIGKFAPTPSVGTIPVISASEATDTAVKLAAKKHRRSESDLEASQPELWIYDSRLLQPDGRPARLVWRLSVRSRALAPIDELFLIDAESGAVALTFGQVPHARNRITYDAANSSSIPGTLKCNEGASSCTGGAIPDADAAHLFAGHAYDFYFSRFQRDGITGLGGAIVSTVRYCLPPAGAGCVLNNAFWLSGGPMVYGPGFLADDVAAHEMTHGVTSFESELHYYGESGAINESLSDIFGEFVDLTNSYGNDGGGVRWLVGEDSPIASFRSMQDPALYGQPDKKSSSLWYRGYGDEAGVHTNSGVGNKAAFLMVEGGAFNGRTVTPLGLEKVAQIYYEAQTALLTSGSDYVDLHNALYQACGNLVGTFGISGGDCAQVRSATEAVEMNVSLAPIAPALACPSGSQVDILGTHDIESPGSKYLLYLGSASGWFLNGAFKVSGSYSLKAAHSGAVSDTSSVYQLLGPILSGHRLYFAHRFGTELGFDGGVVEYSTNNGATWVDAGPLRESGQAYTAAIVSSSPYANNPLLGRPAFTGSSGAGFVATTYNLTPLAGSSDILWRFRSGTDGIGFVDGWYIDDVTFFACSSGNGALAFTTPIESVAESASSVSLTVNRSGDTSGAASASFATATVSAFPGFDYTHTAGVLTWSAGDAHPKSITIPIFNRAGAQAARSFTVNLSNAVGAGLGTPASTVVTINDSGVIAIAPTAQSVAEHLGPATLTVTRTGGSAGPASVSYSTVAGTAAANVDFTSVAGTLNWDSGDATTKTISVPLAIDSLLESTETFAVVLAASSGASLGVSTSAIAILDAGPPDTTPDPFSFTSRFGVPRSSAVTSNVVQIGGINTPSPISVTNGAYSIGCSGSFVTSVGTIGVGESVCVQHTAAAAPSKATTTTLTVGGVAAAFTSMTAGDPAFPDFDGDGHPDIFWNNTSTNELFVWLMNGTSLKADQLFTVLPPEWRVQGLADFNGDGFLDMIWHNTNNGVAIVLHFANGSYLGYTALFALPPEWVIQGVADFNADGKPDLLMRNGTSGVAFVWYFSNEAPTGYEVLFALDLTWKVQGIADFTLDGQPDLLLRDATSGLALVWATQYSGGTLSLAAGPTPLFSLDPALAVVQAADWNGDGSPDLLFRSETAGDVFVWHWDGLAAGQVAGIAQRDPAWEIVPIPRATPGTFSFAVAASNPIAGLTSHLIRIDRANGAEGAYDVAYSVTNAGVTDSSLTPSSPVRFDSGESAKDLVLNTGTTAGTVTVSLTGVTPVAPSTAPAALGAVPTHTATVCATPGQGVTLLPAPTVASPTAQRYVVSGPVGQIISIPAPATTFRVRTFDTVSTPASGFGTSFGLVRCPADTPSGQQSGPVPCKKQGGWSGNTLDIASTQVLFPPNCYWTPAERQNQWHFNVKVDNCPAGMSCQFFMQIEY